MSLQIQFGNATLRDDLALSIANLRVEPQWQNGFEEAFRSAQKYGRGIGNASVLVKFELLSRVTNFWDRTNYQRSLYYSLFGNDIVSPRELWILDTTISPIPFSFGLALADPPRPLHDREGHDGTGLIAVTEFEFVCDLLGLEISGVAAGTVVTPPLYAPNLWLPNAQGIVVRRTSDSNYIRITRDFTTEEFLPADLGVGAPSASNYDAVTGDVEWPDSSRSFGLYEASGALPYALCLLNNQREIAPQLGASASVFVPGYTSTKGLVFGTAGTGPITRTPDNRRYRWIVNAQNEIEFTPL